MTVVIPDETPLAQQRQQRLRLWLLLAPGALWLFFFFVLPLLIVMLYSFATPGPTGNVIWEFNFNSYITLMGKDLYFNAYYRSLWVGIQTTVICLLVGYPLALYMTLAEPKQRNLLLFLVLIPFWTNFLVRTYAWMIILSNNGLINDLLQFLGFAKQLLYPSAGAVLVGLIYGNLPFMVLPLYASLARFDFTLMEASADLGAGRWRSFWRIMFPLTVPGVVAGSVLVFIPTVGQFVVSDLLGGSKVDLLGNLLQRLFTRSNPPNWPLGSALALVFMFVLTVIVIIYFRTTTEEDR
ncbi:MAG: ABC transporter permease [Chloroflexales bacterium]|nr:ABC transporter permease [Chloroflexales bacterium]